MKAKRNNCHAPHRFGLPQVAQMVKNLPAVGEPALIPGLGRCPGQGHSNPTSVFLPGEFHGQRSLAGYSPLGYKESDMTECLTLIPIFPIAVFIPLCCSCVFNCISLMLSCMQHEGILLSMISQSIYCTWHIEGTR